MYTTQWTNLKANETKKLTKNIPTSNMRSIVCGKRILAGLNFVVAATMGSLSVVPDATDFVAVADALGKAAVSAVAIFAEADVAETAVAAVAVAVVALTLAATLAVALFAAGAFSPDAAGTAA